MSLELSIDNEGLVIRATYPNADGPPGRDGAILDYEDLDGDAVLAQRTLDELATRQRERP